MGLIVDREKIFEEIDLIPRDKLQEVYAFIHYFRLGLETARGTTGGVMQYAGCWQDMSDEVYEEFLQDIEARRREAFSGRRFNETCVD